MEHSGCEFYRNGTWYDSKTARAHLQSKYEMLAGSGRINSAEDFIDQAATSSGSLSGRPYQVRCGGGEPIASGADGCGMPSAAIGAHDAPRIMRVVAIFEPGSISQVVVLGSQDRLVHEVWPCSVVTRVMWIPPWSIASSTPGAGQHQPPTTPSLSVST